MMAETSKNTTVETNKGKKPKKEHVWTETKLKYFAIILADKKKQYTVRLDFESLLKSDDFIEGNECQKGKRKDTACSGFQLD